MLQLWQVEVRTRSLLQKTMHIVIEVQRKIKQTPRGNSLLLEANIQPPRFFMNTIT